MNKPFVFKFYNSNPALCRTYRFGIHFKSSADFEDTLDWAETTEDIMDFITRMDSRYGIHEVMYDPYQNFYGFESYEISPKSYITVMEAWRDFFSNHGIECDEIEEAIEENTIVYF